MRIIHLSIIAILLLGCDSNTQGSDTCGDGVIDIGEDCDGSELGGQTCQQEGYYGGEISCNDDCTLNVSSCVAEGRCGDGVVDLTDGEECDGADLNEESCNSLDPSLYYSTVGALACTPQCTFDLAGCFFCGDSVINGEESCDGTDLGGLSCADVDPDYYEGEGTLACSNTCELETGGCHFCGDGVINGVESCDGPDLGTNATCEEMGFPGGVPTCEAACDGVSYGSCHTWILLSSGIDHTCGVNSAGEVYCWGNGANGRLGTGTEDDEPNPVKVTGLTDTVTDISAGNGFTCAVTSNGAVYCWGENLHGKLGTGDTTDHFVPTLINTPLSDFIQVSAGASNACAVRSTGTVQCWGINDNGNMGRCTSGSENQLSPAAVIQYCPSTQLMNVVQVEVAFSHVCARTNATDSNQVYCWGNNYFGQIGLNNTSSPIDHASLALRVAHTSQPTAPVEAQQISVGAFHSCAIGYGPVAQIYCWGNDASGRLGNGDTMGDTTYGWETQRVVDRMANTIDFTDAVTIVTGERHSIAITTDGTPCGWGDNGEGQAGGVTASASVQAARTATMLMPFMPITSITAGEEHSCLVTGDGAAYCFGNNDYGQLGDGSTTSSATPVAVLFY